MDLRMSKTLGIRKLNIHWDSQLVANQLTGEYAVRKQRMGAYMRLAQKLFKDFDCAYIERFLRTNNSHADALAALSSVIDSNMKRIIEVEFLPRPSTERLNKLNVQFLR